MEFNEWIIQKYVEWRGDAVGRERSITEFADYIGVSQQLMNDWMKKGGKKPRSQVTIGKLAAIYGEEVYRILKTKSKDEVLTRLMELYYSIPEDERSYFVDEVAQLALKLMGGKQVE